MQQLVDQGVPINPSALIVANTYPETAGDTFYRSSVVDEKLGPAVGVYGLWNALRADQAPIGGTKVSDDARTIAQFLRLDDRDLGKIVYVPGRTDEAITTVVRQTAEAMRRGDYFEPVAIEEPDPIPEMVADMWRTVSQLDGIGDYITSVPKPRFGA